MHRTLPLLLLIGLLLLAPSAGAQDFESAKKEYNAAFRPTKTAKDRQQAVEGLGLYDTRDAAKLLVEAVKRVDVLLAPILERKQEVEEQLARYMKGKEFDSPRLIDPKAAPAIRKLQKESGKLQDQVDGENQVIESIRFGLARMSGGTALAYLQRTALFQGYGKARQIVAEALGEMGEASSIEPLIKALKDKDGRLRASAASSLGKLEAAAALEPLLALLTDKSWEVRSAAIGALGQIGQKGAVGALIRQLETEEGRLREDCAQALEKLTGQKFGQSVDLWKKWWKEHAHEYGGAAGKPLGGHEPSGGGDPGRGYYGIPVTTNKAIFIIDCSGSMLKSMKDSSREPEQGELSKVDAAKKELIRVIKGFDSNGSFNVIIFNDIVKKWQERMVPAKDSMKQKAVAFVQSLTAVSSTNIYGALEAAFEIAGMGGRDKHYSLAADTIFLLSDGSPTKPDGGADDPMKVIRAVREWNKLKRVIIHTIGIGGHNAMFMSTLARENGGKYVAR